MYLILLLSPMIRLNPDSEEQTIMTNLTELESSSFVNIITAPTPEECEALYNQMIETADQLGGQKLVEFAAPIYTDTKVKYDELNASYTGE